MSCIKAWIQSEKSLATQIVVEKQNLQTGANNNEAMLSGSFLPIYF